MQTIPGRTVRLPIVVSNKTMFEIKTGAMYSVNENSLIHRRFVNSNPRKIPWKSDAKLDVIKLLLMTL